jgi:uncharacterized membrane protein
MSITEGSLTSAHPTFLSYRGMQAFYVQTVLLSSAVVLPIIAHSLHAPVRFLVPMHWAVILAGLLYGWRAGAVTGAFASLLSYVVSGYPLPNILPSMTFELIAYGFFTGLFRQKYNAFASVALSLLIGRIIFIISVLLTHRAELSDMGYFQSALLPGILPAIIQIAALPFLAKWLVKKYYKKMNSKKIRTIFF